jgi:hypothetical protein
MNKDEDDEMKFVELSEVIPDYIKPDDTSSLKKKCCNVAGSCCICFLFVWTFDVFLSLRKRFFN